MESHGAGITHTPPTPPKEPSALSEGLHTVLDVVGMIPIVGELADGANALVYAAEGDYANAAMSAASMVPLAGNVVGAAKLGKRALKVAQKAGGYRKLKAIAKKAKGVTVDISKDIAQQVGKLLKTKPDTAFFWSGRTNGIGGAERALEIAKSKGGVTLEGLIDKKGIKMPEWDITNPSSIKAWEDVSAVYAQQVSGEVRAVVGKNLREGNIWENVELPRLKTNPKVTKITTIDPVSTAETTVFKR